MHWADRGHTIGDYFTLQRGTTYKSRLLGQPGPILLGLASIQRNGGFRSDSLQTYGGESPENLLVEPGDLYASLKDVTQSAALLGAVAKLPEGYPTGRLTQDTVKLKPRSGDAPMEFLYWLLRTPQYRAYCRAHATGTTNLGLAREDFLAFPVPEPTLVRLAIVKVLSATNRKIEVLERTNGTLQATAGAIFKSWFMDFDPVRAKAEGRQPAGMDSETAALFPNSFENTVLGETPKGWHIGRLDDLLVLQRGFDLPTPKRAPGLYPVLSASGPSGNHSECMVKGPGVTTGRSGLLGKVFFVHEDFWPLNTALWVKEFKGAGPLYSYHLLKTLDFGAFDAGSAVPTLNRNHVHGLPVVVPPKALVGRYETSCTPLFGRCHLNKKESSTLAAIQDTLLPNLVLGQISISESDPSTAPV